MKAMGISGHVIGFMIAVTAVTAAPGARAAVYPTNTCVNGKMAATAAYCQSVLQAWGTWDKNQDGAKRVTALSKAATKLADKWQKAEAAATKKGVDCADTTLTKDELKSMVDTSVGDIVTRINTGLNLTNPGNGKCGKKLLNAAAVKCAGLLKAEAKYIIKLNTDTAGAVRDGAKTYAMRTFTYAWFKATEQSCPTTATKSVIEGKVDDLNDQVVMGTTVSPNVDNTQFTTITPTGPISYLRKSLNPICMDGSPYSYFVKRGSVNKLVMYYQGGGACWEQLTCSIPVCDTTVDPTGSDNPNNQHSGFADLTNPDNPFKNWNIVFAHYPA